MVCRECGAYNAEHLTHCRVCSAKLRDDDAVSAAVPEETPVKPNQEESEERPARGFVSAPSWPKSAFAGAPEQKPAATPAAPTVKPAPAVEATPAAKPATPLVSALRAQAAEPTLRRACPHCGKATLADAPYCAYCGELLNAPAGTAAASKTAVAAVPAAVKRPVKQAPVDDFDDDEDEDEDDDEFDEPVQKRRAAKQSRYDDDDFEDDDEAYDDDEDDAEDDDYDDEDDGVYKKRGKGTAILFWGLIALLLVVIVIFGKVIADRKFDGDIGQMFASIGSAITGKPQQADTDPGVGTDADAAAGPNMYTATISPSTDESGKEYYDIDIYAPTGSQLKFNSKAALDLDTATVPTNDHVILHVVRDAFLPNEPCESETITVKPDIQVITPEGETVQLDVPEITLTVPVLAVTLDEPVDTTVQATFQNDPIVIAGRVDDPTTDDDHTVELYINGQPVEVYAGGQFSYTYTPTISPTTAESTAATPDTTADTTATTDPAEATTPPTTGDGVGETVGGATDDTTVSDEEAASDDTAATPVTGSGTGETITIEARKNNCVTARTVITIEPYVIQNMALLVTNDAATGLSASDGNLTLQGTVTPGATITATCASDKVSFGQPTVSATGNFSIAVTIAEVGPYSITLTATQEGFKETSTSAIVERPPTDTYKKFLSGAENLAKILDKVSSGEKTSGPVYATGTVTEIIGTSPYTIFKMKLSDGTEIVACNRSAKSTINTKDVKDKKQVIGNLIGTYLDTGLPYVWAWFILNK